MVGTRIKALLALTGRTHRELADGLGISPQALSNKFQKDSFSASDLVSMAEYFGCKLNFEFADGSKIVLVADSEERSD